MKRQLLFLISLSAIFFHLSVLADPGRHCPESFEKLTQLVDRNFFETRRDFEKYTELFPPSFLSHLSNLKSDGHWLDAGSGEAFALQDFFNQTVIDEPSFTKNAESSFWRPRKIVLDPELLHEFASRLNAQTPEEKPRVTGVSYKMLRADPQIPNLKLKIGRFFEDIPLSEFSPADLITDLYGVISYTPRLDEVLRRYHQLLKDSGRAYLFIGDYLSVPQYGGSRRLEKISEEGWYSPFVSSTVKKADGSNVSLLDWIRNLPGFRSKVEFVEILQPPRRGISEGRIERRTLVLEKTQQTTHIPELKLIESDDGKPPLRKFEEVVQ
ncbi:hypothetical protein EBT16_02450 [bacterium]|nr:hypothetical protein [bacterium]